MRIAIRNPNKFTCEGFAVKGIEHSHDFCSSDKIIVKAHKVGTSKKLEFVLDQNVVWEMVEMLQKRYPNAVFWKTQKQREALGRRN